MYIIVETAAEIIGHRIGEIRLDGAAMYLTLHTEKIGKSADLPDIEENTAAISADIDLGRDWQQAVADWLVSEAGPYHGCPIVEDADFARAARRAHMRAEVARLRNAAEHGGCLTPSGRIDTDPDSQRKISGAVLMAVIAGAEFAMTWRMADDSIVEIDNNDMIAIGVAVGAHVAACQVRKNALDAEISEAETVADLGEIDITTGWPA